MEESAACGRVLPSASTKSLALDPKARTRSRTTSGPSATLNRSSRARPIHPPAPVMTMRCPSLRRASATTGSSMGARQNGAGKISESVKAAVGVGDVVCLGVAVGEEHERHAEAVGDSVIDLAVANQKAIERPHLQRFKDGFKQIGCRFRR